MSPGVGYLDENDEGTDLNAWWKVTYFAILSRIALCNNDRELPFHGSRESKPYLSPRSLASRALALA